MKVLPLRKDLKLVAVSSCPSWGLIALILSSYALSVPLNACNERAAQASASLIIHLKS